MPVHRRDRRVGGFTLIELLIGIVILATLAALIVPNYSGEGTKGKLLSTNLNEIGKALIQMKLDTGCYPRRIDGLFTGSVNTAANSFCGQDATVQWRGPYTRPFPINATGAALMDNISANVTVQIGRTAGGVGVRYFLQASNVPNAIIREAIIACNGSDNTASATFGAAKCIGSLGSGNTEFGNFSLMFDETR